MRRRSGPAAGGAAGAARGAGGAARGPAEGGGVARPLRRWAGLLAVMALLAGCGGGAAPKPASPAPSGSPPSAAKPAPSPSAAPSGASAGTPSSTSGLTHVSFEFAWIPIANQLPFYLAEDRGYFRQHGLDVTLVSGKGSALTAQQVAAGQYDVGQTDLTVMALARGKGAKVRAFMVEFPKSPFGVFASKQEGIATWKDLYGRSVAVSAGSPEVFLLPATFKKLGLDYGRVRVVNTTPANKTPDYLAGKVDAVGTDLAGYIPVVDPKRASNDLWFGDALPVPYLGLFARDAYIRAHPDVIRGIAAATAQAIEALRSDPAAVREAAADMVKANPGQSLNPAVFVASWKIYGNFLTSPLSRGEPVGWMAPDAWAQTIQILHAYAGLTGDLDPAHYYTNAYLKQS
jgi:NitT/TauT family transport system substrate-binding protein